MGGFAVIATQLTDQSLRPWTLTVGGVDVLGLNGSSYGVPIESVEVVEQGPNGVSSMRFRIWDPAKEVNLREMDEVEFWQQQGIDLPFFVGFVQEWTLTTRGIGRYIDVECIGIEAVLDWMIIPVETVVPVDTVVFRAVLALVGRATGVGVQIRAFSECPDEVTNKESSQAFPVAGMGVGGLTPATLASTVTIAEGSSLREALVTVGAQAKLAFEPPLISPAFVTLDFYHGLRMYNGAPTDYNDLSIDTSIGSPTETTALEFTTDAGGVVHQVYVKGGNAAGSGMVGDGTGIPGPTALISDDTSLTADARDAIGQGYLASFATAVRGSVDIGPWTPAVGTSHRAGAQVLLYEASTGLAADGGYIASITKRFVPLINAGVPGIRQLWSVAYGSLRASAIRQIRRATRDTRS